jgi:hypothetical protein
MQDKEDFNSTNGSKGKTQELIQKKYPGSVHVGIVVDKVALGQVFPCQFHSTGAPLPVKLGKKNCSSSS